MQSKSSFFCPLTHRDSCVNCPKRCWLTYDDVHKILGIPKQTLYNRTQRGALKPKYFGANPRFPCEVVSSKANLINISRRKH